jgi:hypothetical protein
LKLNRLEYAAHRIARLDAIRPHCPKSPVEPVMLERIPIINAKGLQLGYIEGNVAFDLSGKERCRYDGSSGNLCDLKSGNIVGYVSLVGTFVGASWVSDELF